MNTLKNIMKKKTILSMLLIGIVMSIIVQPLQVEAATFSVSASSTTVTANTEFTVTFGSGTTGQYTFSVSGGTITSQPDSGWVEGGGTLTVKAGSSGTVKVTVTAQNVTTSDYEDIDAGTSKSVSVTIKAASTSSSSSSSSSTSTTTTTTTTDTRSSDNLLTALSIDDVEISPSFSSSTTAYTAEVWDIDEITISATKSSSLASISGTGTKTLELGENVFYIVVTAENGSQKTYGITVTKNESPTVFFEYNGETLGVVKNTFELEVFPNFDQCVLEYDGEEIYGWYSTQLDMTILYLVNESDETGFYVYEDGGITSKIDMIVINEVTYYVLEVSEEDQERTGYIYEEILIDDVAVMGWGFESETFANYKIIKLMDENGDYNEYLYSIADGTMILSPNFAAISEEEYLVLTETLATLEADNQESASALLEQEIGMEALSTSLEAKNTMVMALGGILGVVLLGMIIGLVVMYKKGMLSSNSDYDNVSEDLTEEEDFTVGVVTGFDDLDTGAEEYEDDEEYGISEIEELLDDEVRI